MMKTVVEMKVTRYLRDDGVETWTTAHKTLGFGETLEDAVATMAKAINNPCDEDRVEGNGE